GREPVANGRLVVGRTGPLPDHDVASRVAQILGLGVSLAAVADDRDGLSLQQREIGVLVVIHLGGHRLSPGQLLARWTKRPGTEGSIPGTRPVGERATPLLEFGMAVDRRLVVIDLRHGLGRRLFGALVLVPRAPYQGDPAGARQFKDLVGAHGFDESLEPFLLTRD